MTKLATSMYKSIAVAPRTISGKDICSERQDQVVGKMPSNRFLTLSKDIQLFCKSKKDEHFCMSVISLQIDPWCTLREVEVVLASSVFHHQLPEDLNLVKKFLAP